MVMLSLNYFQSMCLYTGQWVTFWSQLLPGTVVNGEMTDCQPNPVTHRGLQNELAEPRQASSNKSKHPQVTQLQGGSAERRF